MAETESQLPLDGEEAVEPGRKALFVSYSLLGVILVLIIAMHGFLLSNDLRAARHPDQPSFLPLPFETFVSSLFVLAMAIISVLAGHIWVLSAERKRQQRRIDRLQEALAQANRASKAKSQFLSSISHDIRTPLNVVMGMTFIARSHENDPVKVKACLEKIDQSSRHLFGMVNDVLDLSKIESGKFVLEEAPFNLLSLTSDLVELIQPQAKSKNQRLTVTTDVRHAAVIGDALRVKQVLLNLSTNAVKYTDPEGMVSITVREEPSVLPQSAAFSLIVEDTGVGMDPAFVKRIFDPFEREDTSLTACTEGTGLGMAIVKSIVDTMEGAIDIESEPGVGSRFTVTLTLKTADARPSRTTNADAANPAALHGRVLVAEDDNLNREIACEFIGEFGVTVESACNGREAVDLVARAPENYYDLVFMDMRMPVMDGVEATRTICAGCLACGKRRPSIVAMTASAFVEDRTLAFEAGMDGFVTKPIDTNKIGEALKTYLG